MIEDFEAGARESRRGAPGSARAGTS